MSNLKILKCSLLLTIIAILMSCEKSENGIAEEKEFQKITIKTGNKKHEVSLNYKIVKQEELNRKWKKFEIINSLKIGGINDTSFYGPTQVRTDKNGNIYVLDMAAKTVKKFNQKGELLTKYGKEGRGPGEFQSPFKLDVRPDGKIAVLDPNLNKCVIYDNEKIYQKLLKNQPLGLCFNNDLEFSTLQLLNPIGDTPIKKYKLDTDNQIDFQNLLLTKSFEDVVAGALPFLDGEIYGLHNKEIIYIPKYMNHFVVFSNDGLIKYARNTIDDIALPSDNPMSFDVVNFKYPKEQISAFKSTLVNDKLNIVSYKTSKKTDTGGEYVIDVYSTEKGDYLYSFKFDLKGSMGNIHMTKNKMFILKPDTELEIIDYKLSE